MEACVWFFSDSLQKEIFHTISYYQFWDYYMCVKNLIHKRKQKYYFIFDSLGYIRKKKNDERYANSLPYTMLQVYEMEKSCTKRAKLLFMVIPDICSIYY